jgi:hypothetical protein
MTWRRSSTLAAATAATGALIAGCSGAGTAITPSSSALTSSTSVPATTVASTATRGVAHYPLTGLAVANPTTVKRPALVVKIDNRPEAVPQTGLNQADVVYEEVVEGVTRFFAVFQSTDSRPVGPIRSARTTDVNLVAGLSEPLFAWSGGNQTVTRQIAGAAVHDVGYNAAHDAGGYYREPDRKAPHNLYADTAKLFALAPPGQRAPTPLFTFRADGAPSLAGVLAEGVKLTMWDTPVQYAWDAPSGTWRRAEYGLPHIDRGGVPIGPVNVIVQFVSYVGVPGMPESQQAVTVGEGEAWVFTDGRVVKGRWSRPDPGRPAAYTDADGRVVPLTPGRTWVELPKPGDAVAIPAGVDPATIAFPRF